jgi:exonuclease SbcC
MVYTDLQAVTDQITEAKRSLEGIRAKERDLDTKLRQDEQILDRLRCLQRKREYAAAAISRLSPLSDAANGSFAFSRYVLNGFFHRIVEQANVHLDTMTDGEYQLVATQEGDRRSSLGLGLRILNTLTNLERETASLSGGQMFEASLSLALGLSDVVQMESTSTIRIDSMFIDEGFGSLDGERLDKALDVLQHLSGGKRQIGIISHVARLDECLPRKIHVIASQGGSFVRVEADV